MLDSHTLYGCTSEAHLLLHALERYPERVAVTIDDQKLTYRDVRDEISKYCQALASLGLRRGDRVGLLSGNCVQVIFVNYALGLLGCCLVPLHPKGSLRDHRYMASDAGLSAIVFEARAYGDRATQLDVPRMIALGDLPGIPNLVRIAADQQPARLMPPDLGPHEMCRLSYSGGTTGEPKAIIGTVTMLLTKTMIQLVEWEWPTEMRQLICAPLSHAGGAMVLPTLIRGGSLVVLPGFDPVTVMEAIERHRITCLLMVPTMIASLLDHPQFDRFDLSSLQTIFYGAAAMSPARLREAIERLGRIFFQFYGQTESPMTVTVMRKDEHDIDNPQRLSSCGRPVPWVRVALLDEGGRTVADGEPGEICVRGPLVMPGYWNRPEQTREALQGDWLHTGDMAVRDTDGFLRIIDRKKDMIITGGFNVFAREVEGALCEHRAVAACAVFGIPDARWGEAVAAAVVLKPNALATADELIALVKEIKGAVQAPKQIEFVTEIPLTSLGKPDKKSLRARHAANAR